MTGVLTQLIFAALFCIFYGLFVFRIVRISRTLNTPFYTIFIKLALRTAFFALLLIAFLEPSFGDSKKEIKSVGKDIMICVDLSKSMDAFDVQPLRLEKVKYEMKRIVEAFNSDRVGVIIFSSEAFMQCPLTYDQNALNLFIENHEYRSGAIKVVQTLTHRFEWRWIKLQNQDSAI